MTKKTTKKALLMSALSLLLCFSMLIGTTFAWFTDSVTSANNVIKAGNLDIELEYWNGNEWVDVAGKSDILTNTLWEPGVTEVAYLRVANAGSLALKYQLGINIVSEKAGVNVYGDSFKLSDYIQFGVVEGVNGETGAYATRDTAVAAVTDANKISAGYTKSTSMAAGEELYLALVVWMPTTVGNEANHNGTDVPQIDLGINVIATQMTSEEDSFDKYYDGATVWYGDVDTSWYNTTDTEFVIGNPEQLAGLAAIVNGTAVAPSTYAATAPATIQDSFAGKTIKLASDINLNNLSWTPIGNWDNTFEGTFDGNGHTIYNLFIHNTDENAGSGVGLIGVAQNATIKGINVHNANITGYEMVATIVGSPYSGCTISDCHVTGDISLISEWAYVGGICAYGYTKIDNCSVIADKTGVIMSKTRNAVGGISAWLLEDASAITNCQVKNLELTGWANIGAITGFMHRLGVIDGCSAENVTMTKTRQDGHPTIGLASGGWSYDASKAITITNNTFKNITLNGTYLAIESANILYGAEYGGNTNFNFVLENNTTENITNNLIEVKVIKNADELKAAFAEGGNYALANKVGTEDWTLALTETITVPAGVEVVLYLNGKTIAGTFSNSGNQEMFLVKGNLTVKNGSFAMTATNNQGWNAMATIFDVTAGGVLNMNGVKATVAGTDMNFIVHLNNWGEVTLNVDDCDFTATYVAVRAFNSGPNMNNITIKNTDFHTGKVFWVHNYTSADMGGKVYSGATAAYDKAVVDARLNIEMENITSDNTKPIRIGMTGATYYTLGGALIQSAADQAELNSALSNEGAVQVTLSANENEYTFPSDKLGKGDIIICEEGVVFESGAKLNINGATVVGATFENVAQYNTVNGTFKDCVFEGSNGLRWGYAGETVVFENCVFSGSTYGVHFDGGANEVIFKNCTISGFNATAAAIENITFEGCTFISNGKSSYNGINLWGNGEFIDCIFVFDGSCTYEWIELCGAEKTATFTNCVVTDGTTTNNVSTLIGDELTKREASSKIIVDGVELTY